MIGRFTRWESNSCLQNNKDQGEKDAGPSLLR